MVNLSRTINYLLVVFSLLFALPTLSFSQIIAPSGNPSKASTQLIYYYDQSPNSEFSNSQNSVIQVTNTNDTQPVTIHVQIFRSFDPEPGDDGNPPNVICDERNFIDTLTPNDTHVYDLGEENFFKNEGEDEVTPGESTSIDVGEEVDTKGFVIITPVVSEADLTAIAFEHLIGNTADNTTDDEGDVRFRLNAMGRTAVDLTTGEALADGTPLDGVTTGLVLIQPEELVFNFGEDSGNDVNVVGIAFSDNYGPAGLLGYEVTPSSATWSSFLFDYKEDPTSCGIRPINCFDTMGLTDDIPQLNEFLDADIVDGDDLLCAGVDVTEYPVDLEFDNFGWTRLFVSGLGDLTNHIGLYIGSDDGGARWFNSNKEEIPSRAIQRPAGESTRASSQLIYYYDTTEAGVEDEIDETADTSIQVTNTNDTTAVTVHVQIFRTLDPNDPGDPIICDERNFIDILTPNDTHLYELEDENFPKNIGETEADPGESTSLDVEDSKGFVIITPVVSEADLTAISFQHLIGTAHDDAVDFQMNAVGRDAVDFATGEIVPDGTPLDGTTNGFYVIQPEELLVDFAVSDETDSLGVSNEVDIVGIVFDDSYGPAGLLGYNITPSTANWTSFVFDFKEDPTSCGNRTVNCFLTVGLNDTIVQNNTELNDENDFPDESDTVNDLLCAGAVTPEYPDAPNGTGIELSHFGWLRIFVSGLGENTNHIGFFIMDSYFDDAERVEDGDEMYAKGEEVIPDLEPPAEDCAVEGDEDEDGFADCLDTDCATAESCETGAEECADTMDNDGDGQADCADLGCDGFAGCEFGTETSCEDGVDNDADGATDADDSDCQAADDGGTTGDDGGDGGGCTVAASVTTATAAANFLLPLLPLAGAYGFRRIRKKVLGR